MSFVRFSSTRTPSPPSMAATPPLPETQEPSLEELLAILQKSFKKPAEQPVVSRVRKATRIHGTCDNAKLEGLIAAHTGQTLDLSQSKLSCTPETILKAIMHCKKVILPRHAIFFANEGAQRYFEKEVRSQISALKEAFKQGLQNFGTLKRSTVTASEQLQKLDALEQETLKAVSASKNGSQTVQIAAEYSQKLRLVVVNELYGNLIDQQMKKIGGREFPTKLRKKLFASLRKTRIDILNKDSLAPSSLANVLLIESKKIGNQLQRIERWDAQEELVDELPDQLTDKGICDGIVTNFIRLRLMGALAASWMMWPSQKARFFQSGYRITLQAIMADRVLQLKNRFRDLVRQYDDIDTAYSKGPTLKNFERYVTTYNELLAVSCTMTEVDLTELDSEKRQEICHKALQESTEVRSQVIKLLSEDAECIIEKGFEWIKKIRYDCLDFALLQKHHIEATELFRKYIPITDISELLTTLKEKVKSSDGHVNLGVAKRIEIEDVFTEEDPLAIAFYERIQTLAKEQEMQCTQDDESSDSDSEVEEKTHATELLERTNWMRCHLSTAHRKKIASLFDEKIRSECALQAIEKIFGKDGLHETARELCIKGYKERIGDMLTVFQTAVKRIQDTDGAHALYVKLTAPFELRDSNTPEATDFSTHNFDEFLLYLGSWMVTRNYTHFKSGYLYTATAKLKEKIKSGEKKTEIQVAETAVEALKAQFLNESSYYRKKIENGEEVVASVKDAIKIYEEMLQYLQKNLTERQETRSIYAAVLSRQEEDEEHEMAITLRGVVAKYDADIAQNQQSITESEAKIRSCQSKVARVLKTIEKHRAKLAEL